MFGRKKKKEQEEAFKMLLEGMAKLHENPYDDAAFVNDEDYGYTSKKPIMTFRVPGSNQYLESLVTENGETITWNRVGSTSDPDIDGMIDIYEIFCNANKITTLYLNMYGVSNSKHTPKGFILKGANKSSSNEVAPEIEQPQKPIEKKPEVINNHERNIPPTDNIDDAIKQLKKAIFMSKDPEGLWISLAELYVEKGEMQNARSALNKAQAVNSGQPDLEATKQRILDKLESSTSTISNEPATQSAPAECLSLDAAKEAILKVAKQALSAINAENMALGAEEATKKQFAQDLIWYCAKHFRGFGQEKTQDESILTAFYAGICYTLSTDGKPVEESSPIFSFLKEHMGIDQLERFANSLLSGESDSENMLWNTVSPFITEARGTLTRVETSEAKQRVLEYAVENAYEIGQALACKETAINSKLAEPRLSMQLASQYKMFEDACHKLESYANAQHTSEQPYSLVAETRDYWFYEFKEDTYDSTRFLLRQSKEDPAEVVYFGRSKALTCQLGNILFLASHDKKEQPSFITALDLDSGQKLELDLLGEKSSYLAVGPYGNGHMIEYYPNHVIRMNIEDSVVVLSIERDPHATKGGHCFRYQMTIDPCQEQFIITEQYPDGELTRYIKSVEDRLINNEVLYLSTDLATYEICMDKGKIAWLYGNSKDLAVLYYEKATALDPTAADPWIELSRLYRFGFPVKRELVIEALQKAVTLGPASADLWAALGYEYSCIDDKEAALEAYANALSIDESHLNALQGKARMLKAMGVIDEALQAYKTLKSALENPDNRFERFRYEDEIEKFISEYDS